MSPAVFTPARTRAAATLILVRDGSDGIEVFLLQRTHAASFMPGMFVFPGGTVDQADDRFPVSHGDGLDDKQASRILALETGGLAHYVAAIRECFEESGILLADDELGAPVQLENDPRFSLLPDRRTAMHSGSPSLPDLCHAAGISLAFGRLAYLSHWITPSDSAHRFDTRFFVAAMPAGQTGRHDDAETVAHVWIRPADALARHKQQRFPLAFVTEKILQMLSGFASAAVLMEFARSQTTVITQRPRAARGPQGRLVCLPGDAPYAEVSRLDPHGSGQALGVIIPGTAVVLSPLVRRITAPNPGVMTGPGTNTYLLGRHSGTNADQAGNAASHGNQAGIAVIDPGPALAAHIDSIVAQAGAPIRWILVTHTHPDHSPGAVLLRERTGAMLLGLPAPASGNQDRSFVPQRRLCDGEVLQIAGCRLKVLYTPGHASNHLCYLLEDERLLFTGDQIMQGSTVVINPPDGDMGLYLASLERLKGEAVSWLAPGHGFLMDQPVARIDRLAAHRMARETRIRAALAQVGTATLTTLVPLAYADVAPTRHVIAERSLLAHLLKLQADGLAHEQDGNWRLASQD